MRFSLSHNLPVIFYLALIFYFSSLSQINITIPGDSNGLVFHSVEYFVLGFLVSRLFLGSKIGLSINKLIILSIALSILYGITDEIHQSFIPSRTASLIDLFADSIGSILGAIVYKFYKKSKI